MSFGILPALPEFLTRYPEITLDVSYSDHFVDVIEDGYSHAFEALPHQQSDRSSEARRRRRNTPSSWRLARFRT
jgi:DNA-binding transcriptional LysR family regulator